MFEDSALFTAVYHTFNGISNCVSFFWMYIIIKKSPPEMERFKWLMLKLAICEEMFSFMTGVCLMPYPLLPNPAAICYGVAPILFGEFGARITAANCIFWGASILFSINNCLDYRGLVIARKDHFLDSLFKWKNTTAFIIITHGILAIPTHLFQYYTFEDVQDFIDRIRFTQEFAYLENSVNQNVTILSMNYNSSFSKAAGSSAMFGFGVFVGLNIWRSISVWRSLHRVEGTLSKKAFYLHRRMLLLLFAQNLSPVLMIVVPSMACVIAFLTEQKWLIQSAAFQCVFTLSLLCYPMSSFACSIYFIKPYRQFIISLLIPTPAVQQQPAVMVIMSTSVSIPSIVVSPAYGENSYAITNGTPIETNGIRRLSASEIHHSIPGSRQ